MTGVLNSFGPIFTDYSVKEGRDHDWPLEAGLHLRTEVKQLYTLVSATLSLVHLSVSKFISILHLFMNLHRDKNTVK